MHPTEHFGGVAAFVHAAEAGSFSAAAERMHLSRSAVAKSVARLEERLGTRLFHRTTRSQSLTEDGQAYYERCVQALAELQKAAEELGEGRANVAGTLRITMPVELGRRCVVPILFALMARHPRLRLELAFSDRRLDLVEEGIDLAIRSGPLPDSHALQARTLGQDRLVYCAAPGYVQARGMPNDAAGLHGHEALFYGRTGQTGSWQLVRPDGRTDAVTLPVRLAMDDLDALLQATEAGLGIARLPCWLAGPALRRGSLQRVLGAYDSLALPVHAMWPRLHHMPRKLRVVLDALAAELPGFLDGERVEGG